VDGIASPRSRRARFAGRDKEAAEILLFRRKRFFLFHTLISSSIFTGSSAAVSEAPVTHSENAPIFCISGCKKRRSVNKVHILLIFGETKSLFSPVFRHFSVDFPRFR
jgi:hypothetical protein